MRYLMWILTCFALSAKAQDTILFTLEQCQELARQHYPLLKQQQVLQHILELQVQNINTAWLPQLLLNGQATYQSEVVQLPVKLPGLAIDPPSKDQYRATIDINQQLYDGGLTRQQRNLQTILQQTSEQQLEVEWYKVKQQVTQVYFNVLLADEYVSAAQLAQKDLAHRLEKIQAGVKNGAMLPSSADLLQAALLTARQQEMTATASRNGSLALLQVLTGTAITAVPTRNIPVIPVLTEADTLRRPELMIYRLQGKALQQQSLLAEARKHPRVSAFVQGGYGRPGLNLLKNEPAPFYMTGIRFNWTIWNWQYQRKEQQVLVLQQENVASQAATFALHTRAQLAQQVAEITQLVQTLKTDEDIIALRSRVKEVAAAQLDNGVVTVHDYIQDLDAETQARTQRQTHALQLALAIINYQLTRGY